ncbi:hypothetical protein ANCDUO_10508 [Ancylostoma duodenale]|uniref:Uncharacterized protein n=1 Tax=Ancylostoma duodenale TaxID=51022 RepID=A0A0C2GDN6_9BILA|nr:hypothetical protein ANCDUO_10508 [Ancylostoma duodenale]
MKTRRKLTQKPSKPPLTDVPSSGPIPPAPDSNIHRPAIPMYINVSPKSPAPPPSWGNETPRISRPTSSDDTPMTRRVGHGDDQPYQPVSYYETSAPKGPVPPHSSTTPETSEYIGWTPLPKHKSLEAYDDKGPHARPSTSDYIRAPAIPNTEDEQSEVLDPYITQKTPKYEHALARKKPSPMEELNTSDASGKAGPKNPRTHQVWNSNEIKQTAGMDDPPREEDDTSDHGSTGSYERKKDRQHLSVGRTTGPGTTAGLGAEAKPKLQGSGTYTSRNAMAGGMNSGTAEVVGKKELPTISISMTNKREFGVPVIVRGPSKTQWLPDESWKTSTKYESVLKSKGPRADDMDILKVNAKCCPCCREPRGSTVSFAKRGETDGGEPSTHSGERGSSHSGNGNAFLAQQREAGPSHPNKNFVDDLQELSSLGDTLEQSQRPKVNVNRGTSAPAFSLFTIGEEGQVLDFVLNFFDHRVSPSSSCAVPQYHGQTDLSGTIPGFSDNSVRVEPEQITASANIIPRSHGTIDTLALQRSVSPFASLPGTSSGQYATPWNPGASASFPPPQPLMPLAPQPYSPALSYASPGGGCPCAPRPPPCCAPVQPCCLRKLPTNK